MKSIRRSLYVLAAYLVISQFAFTAGWASEQLATGDFRTVAKRAEKLAEKYGAKNVLLVFDIDNTVLAMNQDLGSDQWFVWQSELLQQKPVPPEAVAAEFPGLLRVSALLFSISKMRATQENLPNIVEGLQKKRFNMLLLTSRGFDLRDATRRELRANELDFSRTAMRPKQGYPGTYLPYRVDNIEESGLLQEEAEAFLAKDKNASPVELKAPRPVSYSQGIYLTAGQHKGAMLRMLLEKSEKAYRAIVFVDDHKHNVDRVFAAFEDTDVEIVTYRYSREDENVKRFREGEKDTVRKQWNHIKETIIKALKMPRIPKKAPAKRAA
jgi:hypothetical protein